MLDADEENNDGYAQFRALSEVMAVGQWHIAAKMCSNE
jgi:hypothetical protein